MDGESARNGSGDESGGHQGGGGKKKQEPKKKTWFQKLVQNNALKRLAKNNALKRLRKKTSTYISKNISPGFAMIREINSEIMHEEIGPLYELLGNIGGSGSSFLAGRNLSLAAAEAGFTINPNKFNYFFGRVVTGSEHNIARSAQNLNDLTTLGISSEKQLLSVFSRAIHNGTIESSASTQYETSVFRTVNIGDRGSISVGFFYEGGNMNAVPSVTTIIPKIFK